MEPMTIMAAASAGGQILSSLLGADAQKDAAKKSLELQQKQLDQQQPLIDQQIEMAKLAQKLGLATQVDANGNITYYDPQTNTWRSILAPTQRRIQDASDLEQLRQLTTDANDARGERQVNQRERALDREQTGTLREQVGHRLESPTYSSGGIAAALRSSRRDAVNTAFDDVSSNFTTQALRSGVTGQAGAQSRVATARARALAQMMGTPEVEGMQIAQELNSGDLIDRANLLNTTSARASNIGNASFNPSTLNSALATAMSAQRGGAVNASSAAGGGVANAAQQLAARRTPTAAELAAASGAGIYGAVGNLIGAYGDDVGSFLANALKNRGAGAGAKTTYGPSMY